MIYFTIAGRVVGQTRSTNQRTITAHLERLAAQYPGQEVTANYPAEYRPRP